MLFRSRFANKTLVRLHLNDQTDVAEIDYTIPAAGLTTLEIYGHAEAAVGGVGADDDASDQFVLSANAAGVTHRTFGQGGSDLFVTSGVTFTLDNLLGGVEITGGETLGDADQVLLIDGADGTGDLTTLNSTTLTGTGAGIINYIEVETMYFEATSGVDTIDVISTALGTEYFVTGDGDSDTITIGNETADYGVVQDGTLDLIQGSVTVAPDRGLFGISAADVLNVDDSGTASLFGNADISTVAAFSFSLAPFFANIAGNATVLTNFASVPIRYYHGLYSFSPGNRLEFLNIRSSTGDDTIAVNATTAAISTTLDTRQGADVVTIAGDDLSANNLFQGFDGNDEFTLNVATHIGQNALTAITGVQIEGNSNPLANTNNRDRLTISDTNAAFSRDLNFDYLDTAADLDVAATSNGNGLFGGNGGGALSLGVRTMETLIFNSNAANDSARVTGTSIDDDLTVALRNNGNSAFVFLNGNPYTSFPPASLAASLPGRSGGGAGTDLLLNGIGGAGLTLDGSGTSLTGNRAIVQSASELNLVDPAGTTDVFNLGLGVGVVVPGFGVGNAYDLIAVNGAFVADPQGFVGSFANQVQVNNLAFGNLVPVQVVPGSFVNGLLSSSRAGLIVNAGDEAVARPNGIADNISATGHGQFNILVNGNLPGLTFDVNGLPIGDQLNLTSPTSLSVTSDKAVPPNVTTIFGNGPFGVASSSIERTILNPGNGVINLIGDNNTVGVDQDDNFVVEGRDVDGNGADAGFQEMLIRINGSLPIMANGVQFLNAYGFDLVGANLNNPGINGNVDVGLGGIDTLDVRPYADNTPRGWGVHVNFNEGVPVGVDGNQADLLIYRTSVFGGPVSEGIVIQPSAPDAGQLFSNNTATNTPVVVIDYLGNTDIRVLDDDGFLSDTDTLTLRGSNPDPNNLNLSGNETVVANFKQPLNAINPAANPLVTVFDTGSGAILYRLQTDRVLANPLADTFKTINFELLNGVDSLTLTGRNDGQMTFNVDGGANAQLDSMILTGTAGGADAFQFIAGPATNQATLFVTRTGATGFTSVHTTDIDSVVFDGGGGINLDNVVVFGSPGTNTFQVEPLSSIAGSITVDNFPSVQYQNLGTGIGLGFSTVNLIKDAASSGNDDSLVITGTANADTYLWTPTGSTSGQLQLDDAAANSGLFLLDGFNSVALDAEFPTPGLGIDNLIVTVANATITPSAGNGAGVVDAFSAANQPLLPLSYANFENPTLAAGAGTVVITGTIGTDVITLALEDLDGDLLTPFQEVVRVNGNPYDVTNANAVVINSLDGSDSITVTPQAVDPNFGLLTVTIPGGLSVLGGQSSQDTLTANKQAATNASVNASAGGVLTGIINGGNITMNGIEVVNVNGSEGVLDGLSVTNYGAASDITTINLNGGDVNNNDGDTIDISMTAGPDLLTFRPTSPTAAIITRGTAGPTINVTGFNTADNNLSVDALGNIDQVTVVASAGNERIEVIAGGLGVRSTVFANGNPGAGVKWVPIDFTSVNALNVDGAAGNDLLDVINDGGLFTNLTAMSSGISFSGGDGLDLLRMRGATVMTATTYTAGPGTGAGRITHTDGVGTLAVDFTGLEPVIDIVAAASHTINANNAANAISYTAGPNSGGAIVLGLTTGQFAIDNLETNEFASKGFVTVNALGGDDQISLNNPTTPSGLVGDCDGNGLNGVQSICVNGGDPTASDILIVNGTAAANIVTIAPTAASAGTVTLGVAPGVAYGTIESVTYNGQGGGDTFNYTTPGIFGSVLDLGDTADSGAIHSSALIGGGALSPVSFSHLGNTGNVVFNSALGRLDALQVNPRDVANQTDFFRVTVAGQVQIFADPTLILQRSIPINTPGVAQLLLNGLDGNDVFNVTGGHPFTVLGIDGNSDNQNDVLNLTAATGDVTIDLEASSIVGYNGTILYSGVEVINASATGNGLTVNGTSVNDHLHYTATGPQEGTLTKTDLDTVFVMSAVGNLTIQGQGGVNTLDVNGTANADAFTINDAGNLRVLIAGQQGVDTYGGINALTVNGLQGNDTFQVTESAVPVFVDGGDPSGSSTGDSLTVNVTTAVTFQPGPSADEGRFDIAGSQSVSFDHIELLQVDGDAGDVATVNGTSADNDITLLATGADDFTISVDGATVAYTDFNAAILSGNSGDDDFTVSPYTPANVALTSSVTINGDGPTGSSGDSLHIDGSGLADAMIVDLAAGTIDPGAAANITFTTLESLSVNAGAGTDTLQVLGSAAYEYSPSDSVDSGSLDTTSLPIHFTGLDTGETLNLNGISLVAHGTDSNNTFVLGAAGLTVDGRATITRTGLTTLTLDGKAGDDTFTVGSGHDYTTVTLSGGSPSSTDVATLTADGVNPVTIQLGTSPVSTIDGVVTNVGLGTVNLTGVEIADVNAGTQNVTVNGTAEADNLTYQPTGADAGKAWKSGLNLLAVISNVGNLTVDGISGDDTLTVLGTASADSFTAISGTSVAITGVQGVNNLANTDALTVNGLQGGDTFTVTPSAIPIFVLGGDPIGVTGDELVLTSTGNTTFHPGPETDEGSFSFAGGAQPVSFDQIEDAAVNLANFNLTILGTNADDDITAVGTTITSLDISVNAGPTINYTNVNGLTIDALSGDDDIDLDVNTLSLTAFTINGNLPDAGGDTLTITGVLGIADVAIWSPTSSNSGLFQVGGQVIGVNPITVQGIESLIYDGENENEAFTVAGNADDNTIEHTPGTTRDSGRVDLSNDTAGPGTLLGINYRRLGFTGSLTLNAGGLLDLDTLIANGTNSNDVFALPAAPVDPGIIDLTRPIGAHIQLRANGVETLTLDAMDGDDQFTVNDPQPFANINLWGGNPSAGSDSAVINGTALADLISLTQIASGDTIAGLSAGITMVHVENLTVNSLAGNDILITSDFGGPTALQNVTFNSGGDATDTFVLVATTNSDSLDLTPQTATTVTARANGVNPLLTVNLGAVVSSTFTVFGGPNSDTATVHGTAGVNTINVIRGATTTVAVDANKRIDFNSASTESLVIAAGTGNDTTTVSGTAGIAFLTVYGGGQNSSSGAGDRLIFNAATGTTTVSPGSSPDAGLINAPAADPTDDVSFFEIENLTINGTGAAGDTLVMQGTHGNDTMALQNLAGSNLVWINDRAVTTFSAYPTIGLAGRFGDDKFNVHPVGLLGVTAIAVTGGDSTNGDQLVVNGTLAADANMLFTPNPATADGGIVDIDSTSAAVAAITFATTESLVINGLGGPDFLDVATPATNNTITVTPGSAVDSGDVRVDSLVPMSFLNLGVAGRVTFTDGGGNDTLIYQGSQASDIFTVAHGVVAAPSIGLNNQIGVGTTAVETYRLRGLGGDDTFNITAQANVVIAVEGDEPGASDVLNFTSTGATVIDLEASTFNDAGVAGTPDVTYSGIETLNALANGQALSVSATANDDVLEVTPFGANAGKLQNNDSSPVVNYSNVLANTVNVSLAAGEDLLVVNGTSLADTIAVDVDGVITATLDRKSVV